MATTFNAAATKTVGVNATNFEFTFTRLERIAFGPGKITTLGAELERMGATRALVATGKTLGASPLLERVTAAMGPHCAGVFAGVGQHVPASSVRALVAEAERVGADALVAFGGGSPIDACKVAAASLLNRRDMTLVAGKIEFDGASRAGGAGREIRLVAVPTTLSAGEFTPGGGVTDEATRVKRRVSPLRYGALMPLRRPQADRVRWPVVSAILSFARGLVAALLRCGQSIEARRVRAHLLELDDHLLSDVGLTRADVRFGNIATVIRQSRRPGEFAHQSRGHRPAGEKR